MTTTTPKFISLAEKYLFVVRSIGTRKAGASEEDRERGIGEPLEVVCMSREHLDETFARFSSRSGRWECETVYKLVSGRVVEAIGPRALAVAPVAIAA